MAKISTHRAILGFIAIFCSALGLGVRAADAQSTEQLQGYYTVKPLTGMTKAQVASAVVSSTTIPMWNYSITSPVNGLTYTGSMVGRSPFYNGMRTTTIQVYLIPTIIKTPDGKTFDPTIADTCLGGKVPTTLFQQSPLFNNASYSMNGVNVGTTQYVDAFQRASFYSSPGNVSATGDRYHTLLNVTTLSPITITIPSGLGTSGLYSGACNGVSQSMRLGIVDYSTLDSAIKAQITALSSSGVGPTSFPIFLMHNVVQAAPFVSSSPTNNCCILGYHGAYGTLASLQTYSPLDFDSTELFNLSAHADNTTASHEVGEWMDDPLGTNPTPSWGHIGQVSGCQTNLEVGDPLSGTNFTSVLMPNGTTYDLQELAFYSWFFRQSPSIGSGGKYSNNGTFTTTQAVCS